jgi:hypothetical protein
MNKMASDFTDEFYIEFPVEKRLETGYADNQPKWPYWVKPLNYSTDEWFKMGYWTVDTMGYSDWSVEHARWVGTDRKYWFRDEQDRTMFILRWS